MPDRRVHRCGPLRIGGARNRSGRLRQRLRIEPIAAALQAPRCAAQPPPRRPPAVARQDEQEEEAKKSAPQGAVFAIVSLADQHVTIYDSTGRIAQSRISTGKPGHPTPIGLFSIIGKERWHRSNIYSGAPMPFMQRITWSGVAMHLGVVPGYPASHGCIRLPNGFAQQFWGMTQIGSRVVVARRDTTPVEISSTFLPVPKLRPAPEVISGSQQSSLALSTPVKLASISEASSMSAAGAQETEPRPRDRPEAAQPDRVRQGTQGARAGEQGRGQPGRQGRPARGAGRGSRGPSGD